MNSDSTSRYHWKIMKSGNSADTLNTPFEPEMKAFVRAERRVQEEWLDEFRDLAETITLALHPHSEPLDDSDQYHDQIIAKYHTFDSNN